MLDDDLVRELFWLVEDLARSRKTGSLKAICRDLAGTPPPKRMNRKAVLAALRAQLAATEDDPAAGLTGHEGYE